MLNHLITHTPRSPQEPVFAVVFVWLSGGLPLADFHWISLFSVFKDSLNNFWGFEKCSVFRHIYSCFLFLDFYSFSPKNMRLNVFMPDMHPCFKLQTIFKPCIIPFPYQIATLSLYVSYKILNTMTLSPENFLLYIILQYIISHFR